MARNVKPRWIMYAHQPLGYISALSNATSLIDAVDQLKQFCKDVYNDECTASLYPYSEEDWAEALEYEEIGCPFDYPSKLIERGPRGGMKVVNT